MEPIFNIGQRVRLANDTLVYRIVDIFGEGLIFKYKLRSTSLEYSTIANEVDISEI